MLIMEGCVTLQTIFGVSEVKENPLNHLFKTTTKKVHFCSSGVIQASVSLVIQIILKKV